MQMRPISSICCSHRRDPLTAPHLLFQLYENLVEVRVVRLDVFSHPVFFIGMEDNYNVAPAWSGLLREQDPAIGYRVDRISEVAVFAADAVQVIAQMAVLGEGLCVVGEGSVFASERKVESRRRW